MAKKDKKPDKKAKGRGDAADVVDAVRSAVERTFQATAETTQPARERGRGLLDEVAAAAQRIRESFDDLRVLEDVRGLRAEIDALSRRVAAVEQELASARRGTAASRSAKASGTTSRARATGAGAASSAKSGGSGSRPAAAKSSGRS